MSQYPMQTYRVGRATQILSVETHLDIWNTGEDKLTKNPLEAPGYSRFKLTIIDNTGKEKNAPYANIPAEEVNVIYKATDYAYTQKLAKDSTPAIEGDSPAYNVLNLGTGLKGRTPADVLLNSKAGMASLQKQLAYLNVQLVEHNNNMSDIEAIEDAIALYEAGQLENKGSMKRYPVITIYDRQFKHLESKKDSNGRHLCYSINMTCDLTNTYPFSVTIENGFAKVNKTSNGGTIVEGSSMVNKIRSSMHMDDYEFVGFVSKMYDDYRAFHDAHFWRQYELARIQRDAWKYK